jgi:hypothetical protein
VILRMWACSGVCSPRRSMRFLKKKNGGSDPPLSCVLQQIASLPAAAAKPDKPKASEADTKHGERGWLRNRRAGRADQGAEAADAGLLEVVPAERVIGPEVVFS